VISIDLLVGLLFVGAIIAFLYFGNKFFEARRKKEVWAGVIEKKWESDQLDSEGDAVGINYNLKIKLDTGKSKKVDVAQETYNALEVGNKVEKQLGALDPIKVA
jgi:hypothetical protein